MLHYLLRTLKLCNSVHFRPILCSLWLNQPQAVASGDRPSGVLLFLRIQRRLMQEHRQSVLLEPHGTHNCDV